MAMQKLQFKPGVNRDQSNYTNEGGWYAGDKIRFLSGQPQKIGGWLKANTQVLIGICRQMFTWVTTDSDNLMAVGTNAKLYIDAGSNLYDITPLQHTSTTLGAAPGPFTATSGSSVLTVSYSTDTAYNPEVGNYVTYSGAATLGGNITAAVLNAKYGYEILTVDTVGKTYTIRVTATANGSDTAKGGATVTAKYDIDVGSIDDGVGYGWDAGVWGRDTWGSGTIAPVVILQKDWFFDNFDNDLVANIRNGPPYYWALDDTFATRAIPMSAVAGATDVPTKVMQLLVSQGAKHLLAFGATAFGTATFDPLLIRWSNLDDPVDWTPGPTSSAGFRRVPRGDAIIRGIPTRQETLVFTNSGLFSLQYVGNIDEVFGLQELSDNISIASPRAVITVNNNAFWMGIDKFYVYSGRVDTLPCTLRNHVFKNINFEQLNQVVCGTNEQWNEVWWHYPTANSLTNNAYVIYNYFDKIWYYGTMNRTAWNDSPLRKFPQAVGGADGAQYIYNHEQGVDDNILPMESYIQSSDFDIVDGEQFLLIKRVIPDVDFNGSNTSTNPNPSVLITMKPRNFPGSAYAASPSKDVIQTSVGIYTDQIFLRARARQMGFEIGSSDIGVQWQLGSPRLDGKPDGKR
jgi:hypothetical protein